MVRRQAAVRTLHQQARVWSVRVLLNLLVVALLGAAFYGVFWATESTVELQVWRGLREEGPGVLEPMFPRVEGTGVYDSWDLSRDGGLCLDLKLQSAEGRRVWGRTSSKAPSGPQSFFLLALLPFRSCPLSSKCHCYSSGWITFHPFSSPGSTYCCHQCSSSLPHWRAIPEAARSF